MFLNIDENYNINMVFFCKNFLGIKKYAPLQKGEHRDLFLSYRKNMYIY